MTLRRIATSALVLCAACLPAGCREDPTREEPTVGSPANDAGPRITPRVRLTESTVEEFLDFAAGSTKADLEYVRAEIEAARADVVILDRIFDILRREWPPLGRSGGIDGGFILVITSVVKQFRSARSEALLHEMTWRPLPTDEEERLGVEVLEVATVEALVCIPGASATSKVDQVIQTPTNPCGVAT